MISLLIAAVLSNLGKTSNQPLYLAFEGNIESYHGDIPFLKSVLGPDDGKSRHQYAYSVGEMPLLTRSTAFLKHAVDDSFDIAEKEDVPIMFHLDPMYGFFADTEKRPEDAPAKKYWNEPEMREWLSFPSGDKPPTQIPRPWFNWGSWVSPSPALPAFTAPKFWNFAMTQMRQGIAIPIANHLKKLRKEHREYLFAGINVGWETHFLDNRGIDLKNLPETVWPVEARGLKMQPWEVGGQTGFASLYWSGWNAAKITKEAGRLKMSGNGLINNLLYRAVHDYMQGLAREAVVAGVARDQIFTHIVAISSAHPEQTSTFFEPIWVAVNPYSVPGFTMDNRGAAVYNLPVLKQQITAADAKQQGFAAIESYLANYRDESSFAESLNETFDNGGLIKVLFGPFGKGTPFALDPKPEGATLAILKWLGTRS